MLTRSILLYGLLLFCNESIIAQKVVFKNIKINDSLFADKTPPVFDISEQHIRISIHHFPTDTNHYQYQFEGIDNVWYDYQFKTQIYYHELPGGGYAFKIRQKSKPNISNSILINIKPLLWQKWWFLPSIYLIFLLIIGSALYFIFLYRLRQEVQLRQVRNHIASDLHDEIGATLSGIGILSTLAQNQLKDSHPSYPLMQRITEDALSIGNIMDDIVWSINPKNDELENIIARMSRFAAELFDAKEIDYQIIIPQNLAEAKLTMEQRRDIYLIFKEAVNNLVKYSKCQKAILEIIFNHHLFELRISDNGIGFDVNKSTTRNGIKNMIARAENLKGNLQIDSEMGNGTSIILKFNI